MRRLEGSQPYRGAFAVPWIAQAARSWMAILAPDFSRPQSSYWVPKASCHKCARRSIRRSHPRAGVWRGPRFSLKGDEFAALTFQGRSGVGDALRRALRRCCVAPHRRRSDRPARSRRVRDARSPSTPGCPGVTIDFEDIRRGARRHGRSLARPIITGRLRPAVSRRSRSMRVRRLSPRTMPMAFALAPHKKRPAGLSSGRRFHFGDFRFA